MPRCIITHLATAACRDPVLLDRVINPVLKYCPQVIRSVFWLVYITESTTALPPFTTGCLAVAIFGDAISGPS